MDVIFIGMAKEQAGNDPCLKKVPIENWWQVDCCRHGLSLAV